MSFDDAWDNGSGATTTTKAPSVVAGSSPAGFVQPVYQPVYQPYQNAYSKDEYNSCHGQASENIKQLLALFNSIKAMTLNLGRKEDGRRFRDELNAKLSHSVQLIRDTQSIIKRLEVICNLSSTSKEKKQKVSKLSKDFEERLHVPFLQLMKQTKKMMEDTALQDEVPQSYDDRERLYQQEQEQMLIQDEADFQDSIAHEREREIDLVQKKVLDINEIFRDLAQMVTEQGELVENIQTNIGIAVENVKVASSEVDQANTYHQSSRKKLCIIAIVIFVVVAIVVGVVVYILTLRKKE